MNLSARIALIAALATVLSACGGRGPGGTGGGSGGNGGGTCFPFCGGTGGGTVSTGGGTGGSGGGSSGTGGGTSGTGGGTSGTGGGSTAADAGQIAAAKRAPFCGTMPVQLRNVVVTAIESQFIGNQGDGRSSFWVAEPTNPRNGLYVFKDFSDTINAQTDGGVAVGDVINIDGFMSSLFSDFGAEAYRYELRKGCSGNTSPLQAVVTGNNGPLADVEVVAPFGVATDGGRARGYGISDQGRVEYAGARVHVPGPLTLSNA